MTIIFMGDPDCPDCRGSGRIIYDDELGALPGVYQSEDSVSIPCHCVREMEKAKVREVHFMTRGGKRKSALVWPNNAEEGR